MVDGVGSKGVSRRAVLQATTLAASLPLADGVHARPASPPAEPIASEVELKLRVNGVQKVCKADMRTTLLDALRERMGMTGTKKGCDHGQCGACTVLVNGRSVLSCLTLAVGLEDAEITTIEGLARDGELHPMQQAFIDHDALQCGYCTPGQILSAIACVNQGHAGSKEEIREFMSGNICRCGAYAGIVAAIMQARPQLEGE